MNLSFLKLYVPTILSMVLHTVEACIVLGIALVIAYQFPEHKMEAGGIAFGALSLLAKGARASKLPVPDYVNGDEPE